LVQVLNFCDAICHENSSINSWIVLYFIVQIHGHAFRNSKRKSKIVRIKVELVKIIKEMYLKMINVIKNENQIIFITEAALKQCRNIARQYSYFNKIFQNSKNSISDVLRDTFTYEDYRYVNFNIK
jgi:hypothetical protein